MAGKLMTLWPRGMRTFRDEMEQLMTPLFREAPEGFWKGELAAPVDVAEMDNAFEVRMDVPAMAAKDFDVDVSGNVVTIRGERKEEKEEKGKTWHRVERRTGSFARTITLPCNINEGEVAAEYADGVLTVKLPKAEDARPRKVTVKS